MSGGDGGSGGGLLILIMIEDVLVEKVAMIISDHIVAGDFSSDDQCWVVVGAVEIKAEVMVTRWRWKWKWRWW